MDDNERDDLTMGIVGAVFRSEDAYKELADKTAEGLEKIVAVLADMEGRSTVNELTMLRRILELENRVTALEGRS
jgi:hypothetical protein